MIFKRPKNSLEGSVIEKIKASEVSYAQSIQCLSCKKELSSAILSENYNVCPYCRHHYRMNARQRINFICDDDSFVEFYENLHSKNILSFPEYDKKLTNAKLESGEKDAVICGKCTINTYPCMLFVMEPYFMMGSMGSVVGEKITRLFERATIEKMPVVGYAVSGGARMQEGIVSLMQMAKTSGAVKKHSIAKNLFISVLTDPTTGGVTASFAMEGDIIIAEPKALVGFAGPRVIEQTIRKKLPENFQSAEFLLQKGFVDDVVDRKKQKEYISTILCLHSSCTN